MRSERTLELPVSLFFFFLFLSDMTQLTPFLF